MKFYQYLPQFHLWQQFSGSADKFVSEKLVPLPCPSPPPASRDLIPLPPPLLGPGCGGGGKQPRGGDLVVEDITDGEQEMTSQLSHVGNGVDQF
jgi:hypothetical protein